MKQETKETIANEIDAFFHDEKGNMKKSSLVAVGGVVASIFLGPLPLAASKFIVGKYLARDLWGAACDIKGESKPHFSVWSMRTLSTGVIGCTMMIHAVTGSLAHIKDTNAENEKTCKAAYEETLKNCLEEYAKTPGYDVVVEDQDPVRTKDMLGWFSTTKKLYTGRLAPTPEDPHTLVYTVKDGTGKVQYKKEGIANPQGTVPADYIL